MTLLTRPAVQFGSLVWYAGSKRNYLVAGFIDPLREFVELERPSEESITVHKHWLTVVKLPRSWKDRRRGNHHQH